MPNEIYHRSEWGNPNSEGWGDIYFDPAATNKLYNHSDYYENSDGTDKILRDIPNKASIVLTPTAYSDGSLNTVIPPYQVLPQEFIDLTQGTAVNPSQWSNITTNSVDFLTGADGVKHFDVTSTQNTLISGKKYALVLEIFNYSGTDTLGLSTMGNVSIDARLDANGVHKEVFVSDGGTLRIFGRPTNSATITLSVKEIQEADFDFSRGSSATRVNEKGLIEDVASGIPRIDYTSGQGALLLEPQSTNLITYSEDFSDSSWLKNLGTVTLTSEVAPDGTTNSVFNYVGSNCNLFTQTQASGVEYTISFFVKSNNQSKDNFKLRLGSSRSEVFTATSEWVRYSYTNTPTSSIFSIKSNGANDVDILIWGAQLEAGSYATSYIPTEGSTVTRAADVANNSGNADLFNDSEGVLYAEIAALADDGSSRAISLSDGTSTNQIVIRYYSTQNSIIGFIRVGGVFYASLSATLTPTSFNKIAFKFKENDFALWINGNEVATDTSGNTYTPNTLNELAFDRGDNADNFYGNVKALAVFKEALTDEELQALTT